MQFVVMAVVLSLAEMGCFSCYLRNVGIPVKGCNQTVCVQTKMCEGLCYNKDSAIEINHVAPEHEICNGEWTYAEKHVDGCPESIVYPVATKCNCTTCNIEDTECSRSDCPGALSSSERRY
uniref:Glycoprotein hormone subunit beta domain-containing protein n=1 Tax=Cyprinodon variegatus TaxID=28743 RepID=A0A3Q2DCV9_CYPVA